MQMKIIGSLLAATVIGTGAFSAAAQNATTSGAASGSSTTSATLTLDQLCMHTRLSATDQAACKSQAGAATTETQRMEVRRTFEAKAGLRAGSAGTSGAAPGASGTTGTTPGTSKPPSN